MTRARMPLLEHWAQMRLGVYSSKGMLSLEYKPVAHRRRSADSTPR